MLAEPVGDRDHLPRRERDEPTPDLVLHGDLQGRRRGVEQPRKWLWRKAKRAHADLAGARRQAREKGTAGRTQATLGEAADADPVDHAHPSDQFQRGTEGLVGLDVDVDPGLGELLEQLGQGGHRLTATDERSPHRGIRLVGDPSGGVGDPVEVVVVEGDDDAVAGGVDIGLEVAVAHVDRLTESGDGVLDAEVGVVCRAAPVGEAGRGGPVEVGVVLALIGRDRWGAAARR